VVAVRLWKQLGCNTAHVNWRAWSGSRVREGAYVAHEANDNPRPRAWEDESLLLINVLLCEGSRWGVPSFCRTVVHRVSC
jgi:hypothetical protein